MNFRTTLIWLGVAAGLVLAIFLLQKNAKPLSSAGSFPVIDPAKVDTVRVRPGSGLEIRVVRTNGTWRMAQPLDWAAQGAAVDQFLAAIQKLAPAAYITPAEVRQRPSAEREYGFDSPKASIMLDMGAARVHLLAGAMTAPGDQFFLQVVGNEGVYVFGADFLKLIPADMNDWRDRAVVDLNKQQFDRVNVTNGAKVFALERRSEGPWRLVSPIKARADQERVHEALEKTHSLRTQQFVSDDPKEDLEPYGLQPPRLEVALVSPTNVVQLQFGKQTSSNLMYARRGDWHTVVTVQSEFVTDWLRPLNEFRERFLLSSSQPINSISFTGPEPFTLVWQTNRWLIAPSNWPGDPDLAKEFITGLNGIPIEQFVNDAATAPDLPAYGLEAPARKYTLRFETLEGSTNAPLELQFGATAEGRTYARRTDEDSIYAVSARHVQALASAPWQLRLRRIWDFAMDDVKSVKVQNNGQTRELIRKGEKSWALAAGSQGVINELAVEDTVRGVAAGAVDRWSALGAGRLAEFGINATSSQLIIELKNGQRLQAALGMATASKGLYIAVTLHGDTWVGEYPWILCRDIAAHLAPPEKQK